MTIGETLRSARESRGFSVQDVQTATHMTARQVQDIENDDFSSFAYPFYAKVFLRQFARAVGLDPAPLVARLAEESAASGGDAQRSPVVPLETIDEQSGGLRIVKPEIPEEVPAGRETADDGMRRGARPEKRVAAAPEEPPKDLAPRPEKRVASSDPMVAAAAAAAAAAKPPISELRPSDAPLPVKRIAPVRPGETAPEPIALRASAEEVAEREVPPSFSLPPVVKKVEREPEEADLVDPNAPVKLPDFIESSDPVFAFPSFRQNPGEVRLPEPAQTQPGQETPEERPAMPSSTSREPDLFSLPAHSARTEGGGTGEAAAESPFDPPDAGGKNPARDTIAARLARAKRRIATSFAGNRERRHASRRDPFGTGELLSPVPRNRIRFPKPSRAVVAAGCAVLAVLVVGGAISAFVGKGGGEDEARTPPPDPMDTITRISEQGAPAENAKTPRKEPAQKDGFAPAQPLPSRPRPLYPPPRCFAR